MNIKEVKKTLSTKLKLYQSEQSAHTDYSVVLDNSVIPLPRLIRVSHGSGEMPNTQVGGIARGLGMSEAHFKTMVRCQIRKEYVDLSIAVKLLLAVNEECKSQGEPMRPGMEAMADSIGLILNAINPNEVNSLDMTASEKKVIVHIRKLIGTLGQDSLLSTVVQKVNELLGGGDE